MLLVNWKQNLCPWPCYCCELDPTETETVIEMPFKIRGYSTGGSFMFSMLLFSPPTNCRNRCSSLVMECICGGKNMNTRYKGMKLKVVFQYLTHIWPHRSLCSPTLLSFQIPPVISSSPCWWFTSPHQPLTIEACHILFPATFSSVS